VKCPEVRRSAARSPRRSVTYGGSSGAFVPAETGRRVEYHEPPNRPPLSDRKALGHTRELPNPPERDYSVTNIFKGHN
jgi:hypothetical protein